MAANHRRIGPNMARHRLRNLDGRSEDGRLWRDVQRQLTEVGGGNPTPGQEILIATAADMAVRTAILGQQMLTADTDEAAAEAERRFGWWSERLRRTLQTLGLDRRADVAPRLGELLGGKAA